MDLGYTSGVTLVKGPGPSQPWDFLRTENFDMHRQFFELRSIHSDDYLMKEVVPNIPGSGLTRDTRDRKLTLTSGFSYDPLTQTAHGYYLEADEQDTCGEFYDTEETPSVVFVLLVKTESTSLVVSAVKGLVVEWAGRERETRPWSTFEKGVQRPTQRYTGITVQVDDNTCHNYVVLVFRIAVDPGTKTWNEMTVQRAVSELRAKLLLKSKQYASEVVEKLRDAVGDKTVTFETDICLMQLTDFFCKVGTDYFFLNDTVACWPKTHGNVYLDLSSNVSPIKFIFGTPSSGGLISRLKQKENLDVVVPGNPEKIAFHPLQSPINYARNPELLGKEQEEEEEGGFFDPLIHAVTMPLYPISEKIEFIPESERGYDKSRWMQAHHFSVTFPSHLDVVPAGVRILVCQPPVQLVPIDVHKRLQGTYHGGYPVIVSLKRQYGDQYHIVKKDDWAQMTPCFDAMKNKNISLDKLQFSNTSVKFPLSIFDEDKPAPGSSATEL